MKIIISNFIAILLFSLVMSSSCSMENKQEGVSYTCTMHPEVKSDVPGQCPKCNMDLVKAESIKK